MRGLVPGFVVWFIQTLYSDLVMSFEDLVLSFQEFLSLQDLDEDKFILKLTFLS